MTYDPTDAMGRHRRPEAPRTFKIVCHRSAASVFGQAVAFAKRDGEEITFDNREDCQQEVTRLNAKKGTAKVHYSVGEV